MAKKKSKNYAPNAPDLQTILLESPIGQLPSDNNQYYPDLAQASPPPYSDLSTETTRMTDHPRVNNENPRYQRFVNGPPGHPTVIVQQPTAVAGRDFVYVRYTEKVRKFTFNLILNNIIAIFLSCLTFHLYTLRDCAWNYVIHQPTPGHPIRISDLRDSSGSVIVLSVAFLILGLGKSMIGYGKSSGCFLFIAAILSIIGLFQSGAMAYLSAYSPCVISPNEIVSKGAKEAASGFATWFGEKMPEPALRSFGETTVFNYMEKDKPGVAIFAINVYLTINYFVTLISALSAC